MLFIKWFHSSTNWTNILTLQKQYYLLIRCRGEHFFFHRMPWIVIRIGHNQLSPMEAGREHKWDRPQPLHDCFCLGGHLKSRRKKIAVTSHATAKVFDPVQDEAKWRRDCQKENVEALWLFQPKVTGEENQFSPGNEWYTLFTMEKLEQKRKENIWQKKKLFITVTFSDDDGSPLGWITCGILSLLT